MSDFKLIATIIFIFLLLFGLICGMIELLHPERMPKDQKGLIYGIDTCYVIWFYEHHAYPHYQVKYRDKYGRWIKENFEEDQITLIR